MHARGLAPFVLLAAATAVTCNFKGATTVDGERYHALDYGAAVVHGPEMTLQVEDCRTCHATDLTGEALAVSCDAAQCHTPIAPTKGDFATTIWRTNCTFCHGGVVNDSGSPPNNLDGTTEVNAGTFPPHAAHTSSGLTSGFDCTECHVKATDVLSIGHAFDDTPGRAEVDMAGGLSGLSVFARESGCSDSYCHGTGRSDNGLVAVDAAVMTCASCHAGMTSNDADLNEMSGSHRLHVQLTGPDVTCGDCHDQVSSDGVTIDANGRSMHVNGLREISFKIGNFTFDPNVQQCTGDCHGRTHNGQIWLRPDGRFHPTDWAEARNHGPEMELQRMTCKGCHQDDLLGNGTAVSCDLCHDGGNSSAWRSDCTYCHGGDDNTTGAPPRDLGAAPGGAAASFLSHTAHVTSNIAPAFDCDQCHVKPTDLDSPDHAFDSTPAVSEVTLAGGLSAQGSYDGSGACSNLYCHGNGRGNNGTITDGTPTLACNGCHASMASSSNAWDQMSGEHRKHLTKSMDCSDCHENVASNGGTAIANPALHVDGAVSIQLSDAAISWNAGNQRCDGRCHGENHGNEGW